MLMLIEIIKKKWKIIFIAFLGVVLLSGAVIGIVTLNNRGHVTQGEVLESLDKDLGNIADDEWTARY